MTVLPSIQDTDLVHAFRQATFNIVAPHLITQNAPSYHPSGTYVDEEPMYALRGAGGRKSGVGALIEDGYYSPELELDQSSLAEFLAIIYSLSWRGLGDFGALDPKQQIIDGKSLDDYIAARNWIRWLHRLHANVKPRAWHSQFLVIANIYHLSVEVLPKVAE